MQYITPRQFNHLINHKAKLHSNDTKVFTVDVRGRQVVFDRDDIDLFTKANWRIDRGYVRGYVRDLRRNEFLHRLVLQRKLGTDIQYETDHINMNSLDNRKANLRDIPTRANQTNKVKSNYHHVSKHGSGYRVRITIHYTMHNFGTYKNAEYAAYVADAICYYLFPNDYVRDNYNFPDEIQPPEQLLSPQLLLKLRQLKEQL